MNLSSEIPATAWAASELALISTAGSLLRKPIRQPVSSQHYGSRGGLQKGPLRNFKNYAARAKVSGEAEHLHCLGSSSAPAAR